MAGRQASLTCTHANRDNPSPRLSSGTPKFTHTTGHVGYINPDPTAIGGQIKGHRKMLDDCIKTYRAVFAAANKSMKTAPASDGQLADQINGLLKG